MEVTYLRKGVLRTTGGDVVACFKDTTTEDRDKSTKSDLLGWYPTEADALKKHPGAKMSEQPRAVLDDRKAMPLNASGKPVDTTKGSKEGSGVGGL